MTDLELRALSIRCPLCQSRPHRLCRNELGLDNAVPHIARIDEYERQQKEAQDVKD